MKKIFFLPLIVMAFAFTNKENKPQGTQLDGSYESKQGVMHNASCHGNNIGILTQDTGERTVICFDEMPNGKNIRVSCQNLHVTGNYRQHTITGGEGPCRAGTITILYVTSYECMDEE